MKINVYTSNLGDFFNVMPVISGLSISIGETVDLVVHDNLMTFNGFRAFMEFQPCINSLRYRKEILNMNESSYIHISYSQEEYRHLSDRPNRPIETMRHEKFVRDNYPNIAFEVDDDFEFRVHSDFWADENLRHTMKKTIVGDRWLVNNTDVRRSSNILKDSGLFDNPDDFYFLDYNDNLMTNAMIIANSEYPFVGTFTGVSVLADLLKKGHYVLWDDSMVDWNGEDIRYSHWKHFYGNRKNLLMHIDDWT